ncbi:MAG: hypothetical protein AB1641_11085 [Thermodesulfobacteriota bacterium]
MLTWHNVQEINILAKLLAVGLIGLIYAELWVMDLSKAKTATLTWALLAGGRLMMIGFSAGYLMRSDRPATAREINPRHHFRVLVYVVAMTIGSAFLTGLEPLGRRELTPFLVAVFLTAFFLPLSLRQSFWVLGAGLAALVGTGWLFQPAGASTLDLAWTGLIQGVLALVVSRFIYLARVRDLTGPPSSSRSRRRLP